MLFAATRTSGTVTPPDGAGFDSVTVTVAAAPPSERAVAEALREISEAATTVTATEGTVVPVG